MGDESGFATGGFVFRATDSDEWENLGYVGEGGVSLSTDSDDDETELWAGRLMELSNEPITFRLKSHWWSLNRLYKLVTGRCRYTVPKLRRDRKGHPRCW